MCAAAARAEQRTHEGAATPVDAQTALNLIPLLAPRGRAASSASFCAAEASVRVPLDSLRTCERKCRRLNARGRSTFNCLPLVTWQQPQREDEDEEEEGEEDDAFSLSLSREAFCRYPLPSLIAADGQFVLASVFRPASANSELPLAPRATPFPRSCFEVDAESTRLIRAILIRKQRD